MKTIYYPEDDILELHFSKNPIVKETAQEWNIVLLYDANNHLLQMVVWKPMLWGCSPSRTTNRIVALRAKQMLLKKAEWGFFGTFGFTRLTYQAGTGLHPSP